MDPEVEEVRRVIRLQQEDWNRGDIEAFMRGYERSESLIFTGGGKVYRGWDAALRRYRESYPDREAMGRLEFSDVEITMVGDSAAVVLGRWIVHRKGDRPTGVFTLVFRKGTEGWKIIHDHTSKSP